MLETIIYRTKKAYLMPLITMLVFTLISCSGSDEDESKQSSLERKQHEIAAETKEMIIVPIEKARMAKGVAEDKNQKILEELEKE